MQTVVAKETELPRLHEEVLSISHSKIALGSYDLDISTQESIITLTNGQQWICISTATWVAGGAGIDRECEILEGR